MKELDKELLTKVTAVFNAVIGRFIIINVTTTAFGLDLNATDC